MLNHAGALSLGAGCSDLIPSQMKCLLRPELIEDEGDARPRPG
jgi:hypothetical protein